MSKQNSKLPQAVSVFLLSGDRVWVSKRSENLRQYPGYWQVPGGKVDPSESALDAAIRELSEETGLVVARNRFKKIASNVLIEDPQKGMSPQYEVTCFKVKHPRGINLKHTEPDKAGMWIHVQIRELDSFQPQLPILQKVKHLLS